MHKTYTTKAIILNRIDIREADRLFVLYTKDYGKIEAVATSARKSTSKMAKFLEPMMAVDLLLARGRNFDRIAEVKLINGFQDLKTESQKWGLGCYCLEVIDKLTKVEVSQREIFDLLKDILELLKQDENKGLVQFYVWQLLDYLGYKPQIERCISCQKNPLLTEEGVGGGVEGHNHPLIHSLKSRGDKNWLYFNPQKGGIICPDCLKKEDHKGVGHPIGCPTPDNKKQNIKVSNASLNHLKTGLTESLQSLQNMDIMEEENIQINQVISSWLHFNLDYKLNTIKFLQRNYF